MFQSHVGNHRNFRDNHVGGVPQTSHAYFNHGVIHLLLGKVQKTHGRNHFKLGGFFPAPGQPGVHCLLYLFRYLGKVSIGNFLTVDGHSLVVPDKMGGSIGPGLFPGRHEYPAQERGHTALAVSSGNMNGPELAFRMVQGRQNALDSFQAQMNAELAPAFHIR